MHSSNAFYFLIAADDISSFEQECFDEIAAEILGDDFSALKDEVVSECEAVISSIEADDERYDVIREGMDLALSDSVETIDSGVVPRLLLWDMLTLAHSDFDYSEEENRLISHVARVLRIDKSVSAEMKQLISTARSILDEKNALENSSRPYSEIRPLVDEVEKRQQIIVEAAKALIADDVALEGVEKKEKEENKILTVGKKISESVVDGGKRIGESVVDGGKKIGESVTPIVRNIGGLAASGASGIANGAGKLISKMKSSKKKDDDPN